jgi:hypothetical protein
VSVVQDRPRQKIRLALTRQEAADAIGVSLNSFIRYVQPELPVVRRGALRLFPVKAIEEWLERNAGRPLERGDTCD